MRNGEGALRFWGTQKPSCPGPWCAPQRVAAEPGEDTIVPSVVPSRLLPSLACTQESYINGLCGHRIHEGSFLTLNCPYSMEACPICTSCTTHFKREGQFFSPFIYIMLVLVTECHFDSVQSFSRHHSTACE